MTAWLGEVSPGVRLATALHPEVNRATLSVRFTAGRAISRRLRPTAVGFGLSYTLPVLVALLASKPGSLVLLENPEAHLHPRGQMAMGDLLARAAAAGIQAVVETHSDHVLNGVRLMALAESLGGVETLISHPASMTHASVPVERRLQIGITDGLVRVSVGIEDLDDLQDDLEQALDRV